MTDADTQDLLRLADELEKATGPDRELDMAITLALGLVRNQYERATSHGRPLNYFWHRTDSHAPYVIPEAYTASLDAAMMLVPEGAGFNLDRYWLREGVAWKVEITTGGIPEQPRQVFDCWDAYTASLAITAAALKARAHSTKESDNE